MTYTEIDIEYLIDTARIAGVEIMRVYAKDFAVEYKSDYSPVTEADKAANEVIIDNLINRYPDSKIISEEIRQLPYIDRKDWDSLWMIDPLDGTKEFIKKNGEFTVNIALIENGEPTFGVVYAPVPDVLYYGMKGDGSYKIANGTKTKIYNSEPYHEKDIINVVGSRSHINGETLAFVTEMQQSGKQIEFLSVGSSLKLCLVAEGVADVYPRFNPTMEWDTAAAHAVAIYAGRQVLNAETREPLVYNKPDLLNPSFIVC